MISAPLNYWKQSVTDRMKFLEQQRQQLEAAIIELQTAEDKLQREAEALQTLLSKTNKPPREEEYEFDEEQDDEVPKPPVKQAPPAPTPPQPEKTQARDFLRNFARPKTP